MEYKQGSVICGEGKPMDQLLFITGGKAEASFKGKPFIYEQGDVIGICELSDGVYSSTYTAVSDVVVFSYPYRNLSALEGLLREKPDIASLLINSMCRQLLSLLQYKIALKNEAEMAFESVKGIYAQYGNMCTQYAFTAKKHEGVAGADPFPEIDLVDEWIYPYYMETKESDPAVRKAFFNNKPGITLGFIRKGAEDARLVINICKDYINYINKILQIFLRSGGHDLFALISELHCVSINIKGADAAVGALMAWLTKLLSGMTGLNHTYYQQRMAAYKGNLAVKRASQTEEGMTEGPGSTADSMNLILEYSGRPKDICSKFIRNVQEYTKLSDRGSAEDAVYRLRRELTAAFYDIYQGVLIKSLKDPAPPTIIKMFLNFGYVDAALAGQENADYLYSVADSLKGDPEMGVYTAYEWLAAIYGGRKEPCRNELDEDYAAYLRGQKATRKIDDKEEARLLNDLESKLRFEIENVFPVTNKITCGIISTYCPLLSSHNIQRKLEFSLVTPKLIMDTLDEIRGVDFSAYFREVMYSDPVLGTAKEVIHVEVLPDFILMPTVGIRGIMWQEIEGMKRATPSRMFMPLFLQSDLKALLIRLTSEFRWEMCKRVQGVRWTDITDPSLTSEYSDYLQFYRNNRDLSAEVKESIKTELTRARNNYKTAFSLNYTDWMQYEANGSSRLNRTARRIILAYCPFPSQTREKLKQNPQFSELLNRYNVKQNQRVQQLSRLINKVGQSGKKVPQELHDELEYAKK